MNMYQLLKNNIVQYILDYKPTSDVLEELGCDSYWDYKDVIETQEKKKSRIQQSIITSSNLEDVDIEGIEFSSTEIGDIIQARVFWGNPHAESALQAKTSAYLLSVISGEPNDSLLTEIQDKQMQVNEVRVKFGLSSII